MIKHLACALVLLASTAAYAQQPLLNNPYNMSIYFWPDASQQDMHRECPDEPKDAVLVACGPIYKTETGYTCSIMLAPAPVILKYGGYKGLDLFS